MKKVLVLNCSARNVNSHSRKLTETFVSYWLESHPDATICHRELGMTPVPHINEAWINAAFKPALARSEVETEILKTSAACISELHAADVIVIGSPMYNWSVPSSLKAYIDTVVRINETWEFNPDDSQRPYKGLLHNKKAFLLLSRGSSGYNEGELNHHMDFQSGYLKTVLGIMGITDIHIVALDGTSSRPAQPNHSMDAALQNLKHLIDTESKHSPAR